MLDLPDEICLTIFKKLSNLQVLYSLFGINQRLNTIVRDPTFTSHLTLFERLTDSDGFKTNRGINPLSDFMIDRFYLQILPAIHDKIKWLDVEPTCLERVLLATKYPNLNGLGIYGVDIADVVSLLTDKHIFSDIRNQIVSLDVDIPYDRNCIPANSFIIAAAFVCVFDMFSSLKCLKFALTPVWHERLFSNNSLLTVWSSSLLELHVSVHSFSDCLYILDGRFDQLRTFRLQLSSENLPNLRYFSLYCDDHTYAYDELIVPLLRRMMNLEELDLDLTIVHDRGFVDGNDLKENIIKYMPRLKQFTFDIRTLSDHSWQSSVQSTEDVQRTFKDLPAKQIVAWTDYLEGEKSQCYVHSYPYRMRSYDRITNQFPGGLFQSVTRVSLYDQRPFEREFFVRIAQSFPMMKQLQIINTTPQKNKLQREPTRNDEDMQIITFRHLLWLFLLSAHDDYVEQFLLDTEVSLPNNVRLLAQYESLEKITHNFQREETRINCAKIIYSRTNRYLELPEHIDDYFAFVERD